MNGDRKLRLVPPPEDTPPADEASAEERVAAEALRDALAHGEEPLAAELRAAFAPAPLAEADLDAILARALGDEAAATAAERRAADRLRAELDGEAPVEEAALLRALKVAAAPAPITAARNEALLEAALARQPLRRRSAAARRLAPVTMAALAGITALAAGVALFLGAPDGGSRGASATALIRARSADALFDATTPFPRSGEESARVDRIASARARDLRKNRYASWGVR
jgi:hypothetical protein